MSNNYKNIIESKNIDAIEFYLKKALRDVEISKKIIRNAKSEIKEKQKSIDDFEKNIEKSLENVKILKKALKLIKTENKE